MNPVIKQLSDNGTSTSYRRRIRHRPSTDLGDNLSAMVDDAPKPLTLGELIRQQGN